MSFKFFIGKIKDLESVSYYAPFHSLLNEINEAEKLAKKQASTQKIKRIQASEWKATFRNQYVLNFSVKGNSRKIININFDNLTRLLFFFH